MEEGVLGFYAANAALSGLINKDDGGYEDDDDGMYLFRHNVAPSKIEKEMIEEKIVNVEMMDIMQYHLVLHYVD